MSRIRDAFTSKLTWYLAGGVLISGLIASGISYALFHFAIAYMEMRFDDPATNKTFQIRYLDDLQQYINDNSVTADNINTLQQWADDNRYVYFSVYQNNQMIFNSDYAYVEELEDTVSADGSGETTTEEASTEQTAEEAGGDNTGETSSENAGSTTEETESDYLYLIQLSDGSNATADIFCYDFWKYYNYVLTVVVCIGVVLFVLFLVMLMNKKIRYINSISRELQILEGGNLEYPITVRGTDEISKLAQGIDQMRLSIVANMQKEQEMLQSNKELVTSMSHDLRTPLTTLTGYLEMLTMGKMTDEDKRRHYLELSLAKCQEIRRLSDDLFEYFLIYGEDEKQIEVEPVMAYMLAEDMIGNQLLELEEEGFVIEGANHVLPEDGDCLINSMYMQRVLNNLISNLRKYADPAVPIRISACVEQSFLVLQVKNGINHSLEPHESTKIGLITCERILRLHRGEFRKFETADEFIAKLMIPMRQEGASRM